MDAMGGGGRRQICEESEARQLGEEGPRLGALFSSRTLELVEALEERLEHPRRGARGGHQLVDAAGAGRLVEARRQLRLVVWKDAADAVAQGARAQHPGIGRRMANQLDVAK